MLSVILFRAILVATPFVIWFTWRAWAIRNGRVMGATPWGWLTAAGALLAGLSLIFAVAFQPDNRGTYVPGQVQPDGTVSQGRFEPAAKP